MKTPILALALFAGCLMISSASTPAQARTSGAPTQAAAVCNGAVHPTALSAADDPKPEPKKDDDKKKDDGKKDDDKKDAPEVHTSGDTVHCELCGCDKDGNGCYTCNCH